MSSELKSRLQADLNRARKERDRQRTLILGTTISEIRNREIDQGREAGDEDVLDVLTRAVKQRREAADQMRSGGREELAAKEESEAVVLQEYMPEPLAEDEVRALVREAIADGATDMGAVMGRVMPRLKGRFDGKEANRIVREELGAR
ncbi:MAG: GatB/YqeY domain-containing protein [Gemmatimonadetes bacterium]|nr:GatB/YqeY domain-containing protein [Gemmatimonadota bacterium]